MAAVPSYHLGIVGGIGARNPPLTEAFFARDSHFAGALDRSDPEVVAVGITQ